ncbi:MAG: hypothetical protein PHR11_00465 [Candidatus Omnitrophica bacterium]|nr:hypothetical protein [Candidatus Omnitrophota bacterium]
MENQDSFSKQIKELIGNLQCPKEFRCCKLANGKLCKAEDIGCDTYIKCLEEKPQECKFALPFGYSWNCSCPLRIYIMKQLKK